ncbi:hypothetical protein GT037_009088 [Alternaria burnsii]|uniref:Uncharacterized protein n=1 Tax=Alternaria burnsii TaxID=1187904 RepID=A0A8H7AYW4_9PLEO|nr:uncharacterized protein GT037_009088 [Alternaria burnsii]KAF7673137.1 hypothetical protein GT037_009088 [Alternaria burnsii]
MLETGSGHEAEGGSVLGVVDGERGSDCLYDTLFLISIQAKQPSSKILSQLKEGIGPSWVREG